MNNWWYAGKKNRVGPISLADLERLVHAGDVSTETLVWRPGMENWRRLDEIDELNQLRAALPPPIPKESKPPIFFPATRWPRFLARLFDVWILIFPVAFGVGYILGILAPELVQSVARRQLGDQFFGFICLPICLAIDAAIYGVAGNTLGKALLGLRVATLDGRALSFGQYLGRNLNVWASGFACGVPLVYLFTMASQSSRLKHGGQASYDEIGYRVFQRPIGWLRRSCFGLAFACVVFTMLVLNGMEQERRRKDTQLQQAVADATRRGAEVNANQSGAKPPPAFPSPSPLSPTKVDVTTIEAWGASRTGAFAKLQADYEAELSKLHLDGMLTPEFFKNGPSSIPEAKRALGRAHAVVGKYKSLFTDLIDRGRDEILRLPASDAARMTVLSAYEKTAPTSRKTFDEQWTREDRIISELEKIMGLLEQNRWQLAGDQIHFASQTDLALYQGHLRTMRSIAEQEEQAQQSYQASTKAALEAAKATPQ
jgi:uncharacterized RDD family membrane protein YckC